MQRGSVGEPEKRLLFGIAQVDNQVVHVAKCFPSKFTSRSAQTTRTALTARAHSLAAHIHLVPLRRRAAIVGHREIRSPPIEPPDDSGACAWNRGKLSTVTPGLLLSPPSLLCLTSLAGAADTFAFFSPHCVENLRRPIATVSFFSDSEMPSERSRSVPIPIHRSASYTPSMLVNSKKYLGDRPQLYDCPRCKVSLR